MVDHHEWLDRRWRQYQRLPYSCFVDSTLPGRNYSYYPGNDFAATLVCLDSGRDQSSLTAAVLVLHGRPHCRHMGRAREAGEEAEESLDQDCCADC